MEAKDLGQEAALKLLNNKRSLKNIMLAMTEKKLSDFVAKIIEISDEIEAERVAQKQENERKEKELTEEFTSLKERGYTASEIAEFAKRFM